MVLPTAKDKIRTYGDGNCPGNQIKHDERIPGPSNIFAHRNTRYSQKLTGRTPYGKLLVSGLQRILGKPYSETYLSTLECYREDTILKYSYEQSCEHFS